jgi:hypothetical protein
LIDVADAGIDPAPETKVVIAAFVFEGTLLSSEMAFVPLRPVTGGTVAGGVPPAPPPPPPQATNAKIPMQLINAVPMRHIDLFIRTPARMF